MHILLAHTMGISQCPGCPHPDETIDHHLFQCPNRTLSEECSSLLSSLRKEGLKLGWPRPVLDGIIQLIQDFIEGSPPTLPQHPHIWVAVEAQIAIGVQLLPCGFLSNRWIEILEDFHVRYPQVKITSFLCLLWLEFTDKLWCTRNEIVHHQENANCLSLSQNYKSRLRWYLENTHVLSQSDQFILHFTLTDIDHMTVRVKKHTLHHLDVA